MSVRNEGVTFIVLPPFIESLVGTNVEALFWERSLGKYVAHVRTKDKGFSAAATV